MRRAILFTVLLVPLLLFSQTDTVSTASCCGGKCTGSAHCTACKNCSACKHCSSGGSCGVCNSGYRSSSGTKSSAGNKSNGGTTGSKSNSENTNSGVTNGVTPLKLVITTQALNLREVPNANSKVLLILKPHEVLTVLEGEKEGWIKVSIKKKVQGVEKDYTGYVNSKYVI